MVRRLFIGILKGLLIGGALGALVHFVFHIPVLTGIAWAGYLLYGLVGAAAGALAGKVPWRKGAWIESLLKGLFGIAVGCGLYALASAFLSASFTLIPGVTAKFAMQPLLFAPALAALYAGLVELDNDGKADEEPTESGVRVGGADALEVDEDEAPAKSAEVRRKNA